MTFLLDTNVISEPIKPRPDVAVVDWLRDVASATRLSVMTLGEMRKGAQRMRSRDGARAAVLDEWIATTASRFADRIAPIDVAVAQRWGHLAAVPDPLPVVDSIIAATALTHGWTVATRNTADFARFGVELHNPFRG